MTHETLTNSQLSFKAAALRMFHLPLSVYGSMAEVSWSLESVDTCSGFSFHFWNHVDCYLPLSNPPPPLLNWTNQSLISSRSKVNVQSLQLTPPPEFLVEHVLYPCMSSRTCSEVAWPLWAVLILYFFTSVTIPIIQPWIAANSGISAIHIVYALLLIL